MNISIGYATITSEIVKDGVDSGTHTAKRSVLLTVTDRKEDTKIELTCSPSSLVNIATSFIRDAWNADKAEFRGRGETYRKMGFFE